MSLTIKCSCGSNVEAPADAVEKRINCPNCGSVIFFVRVGAKGPDEVETYGFASDSDGESGDPLDVAPDGPDASSAPCWLDRYKSDPAARREHEKTLALIRKASTTSVASDPFVAALVLATLHPRSPTTIAALARVVIGRHPAYAPIAAAFLEHVGSSEARAARETLRLFGEIDDASDQLLISTYLRRIGPTPFIQVRELIDLLCSKHTMLFVWAVQCLGLIGPAAGSAVEVLLKLFKIPNHDLRLALIDALGLIAHDADRAVPVLLQAVKQQSADYRLHAAQALGHFDVPSAKAALKAIQNDSVAEVRQAALSALRMLAAKKPRPVAPTGSAPATPIEFACGCGKRLRVKPELAGRKVKCPACGAATAVPVPRSTATAEPTEPAAPASPSGEKVCPDCLATVPDTVVLCVHCGLDFRTGKHMAAGHRK